MVMTDSKESCLAKNPLFRELPKEKLTEIAGEAQYEVVPPSTIIFQEGDPGDSFYMINFGRVRLSKKGRGREISVAELGPGDFFGQLEILTDELRWVNVKTLEETRLTILPKKQFDGILKEYPDVSFAFAKQMSKYFARNIQVIKTKSEHRFQVSKTSWIDFLVIFILSLLCGIVFNHSNPNGLTLIPRLPAEDTAAYVTPSQAEARHAEADTLFLDARPSILYEQMHIEGAVNIPSAIFDIMHMVELGKIAKEQTIIVYGRTFSSHYDEQVARKLSLRGYENTMILKDGLSAWRKEGYPVKP